MGRFIGLVCCEKNDGWNWQVWVFEWPCTVRILFGTNIGDAMGMSMWTTTNYCGAIMPMNAGYHQQPQNLGFQSCIGLKVRNADMGYMEDINKGKWGELVAGVCCIAKETVSQVSTLIHHPWGLAAAMTSSGRNVLHHWLSFETSLCFPWSNRWCRPSCLCYRFFPFVKHQYRGWLIYQVGGLAYWNRSINQLEISTHPLLDRFLLFEVRVQFHE